MQHLTWILKALRLLLRLLLRGRRRRQSRRPWRPKPVFQEPPRRGGCRLPKPEWAPREVVRLKALDPQAGCRRLATTFNHMYNERRGMTVSKSWVAKLFRDSQLEVLRKRREIRRRKPRATSRNGTWGLDLTFLSADAPTILGIIDHGFRACLALQQVESKTAIVLLRRLLDVVELFGKPKTIRTDNEAMFRSRLWRVFLTLLGIRPQRIAPMAPWQNGRIERFFGTFKTAMRRRAELGLDTVPDQADLDAFQT